MEHEDQYITEHELETMVENFEALEAFLRQCQQKGVTFRIVPGMEQVRASRRLSAKGKAMVTSLGSVIRHMIQICCIEVCPSPNAHRWSWYRKHGAMYKCECCEHE